ncbi:DUF2514 family protein [Enterobacter kobei]|uniref:DUF2514 family protein n=1 Tax=Enterobacter kobei TaxID=208224 RepID=UPI003CF02D65
MISIIFNLLRAVWRPLLLMMAVVLLLWGYGHLRFVAGQTDANRNWSLKWAQRDAADNAVTARHKVLARSEEQRRQDIAREEQKHADEELVRARDEAADAQRAGDELRRQLVALQRQLANRETRRIPAPAATGTTDAEAIRVLAQLLCESEDMAAKYAAEADRTFFAGKYNAFPRSLTQYFYMKTDRRIP